MTDIIKNVSDVKMKISLFNIIEVIIIQLAVIFSLIFQIFLNDKPCILCLLQRVGFFGIILGLLMNLRFGLQPKHYSIILLSAFFTSLASLRQIAINVVPEGGFGTSLFGFHMYTWSFFVSTIILILTTLALGINRQFYPTFHKLRSHWTTQVLLAITTFIFVLNLILLLIN
jgi:disulfide bond formation protein DsbB